MKFTNSIKFVISAAIFVAASQPTEATEWTLTKVMSKPGVINHHIATPTGDFLDFIKQSTIWVDKSMLIKSIWDSDSNISVICAPPGWGKTINLSMLKFYLQLNLNYDGSSSDRTTTESYQYFVSGKISTNGTIYEVGKPLISGYKGDNHLGKYPIIYLDGSVLDMEEGIDSIRRMICATYQLHDPFYQLMKNNLENNEDSLFVDFPQSQITQFERFFNSNLIKNVTTSELENSIVTLSWLLSETYYQKVIILFDNYDAYVHKAYFDGESKFDSSSRKVREFIQLLNELKILTFKSSEYLEKSIITGVLGVQDNSFDSLIDATYIHIFADHDGFAPFYGVLEPEFAKIAQILNWNDLQIENITRYQGGYQSLSLDAPIYPSYSIAASISNKKMDQYWTLTNSQNFLLQMLKQTGFQNDIITLLRQFGGNQYSTWVDISVLSHMPVAHCEIVQENLFQTRSYDNPKVFAVLLSKGIVSIHPRSNKFFWNSISYLYIPNFEIWNYLKDQLLVSMGLQKDRFSFAESSILNYVNDQDDLNTLPSLTESISKSLFDHSTKVNLTFLSKSSFIQNITEDEPELPIESLIKLMFRSALLLDSSLLVYESDKLMMKIWNEIHNPSKLINLPLLIRNSTILSLEVKYRFSDQLAIQEAFNESLSYSRFLRGSNLTQYPNYKFLAIGISEGGRVDAKSLSISSSNLSKIMIEAEKKLDHCVLSVPEKQRLNYQIWKGSIMEETLKMHRIRLPLRIFFATHVNLIGQM